MTPRCTGIPCFHPLLPAHGVTTAISGNCGLTLAPMKPEDRDSVRLLANVEGIPSEAIAAGVDFTWETFPEMMTHLATPHSASTWA